MHNPDIEIIISERNWQKMREGVVHRLPEEVCGLLAGVVRGGQYWVKEVLLVENILHSRTRFRMDAQQQINAFNYIESHRLTLVGIFHSHPKGPATPSSTDIREAYYPECVYLICSPSETNWQCRGFIIQGGTVREVPVRITASSI